MMQRCGIEKKGIIFSTLSVILILTGCSGGTSKGTEGLSFAQNNGSYYVDGYSGDDVNIVIPDKYNDVEVTGVYEGAFHESDIQSVKFGKNIVFVGDNAFSGSSLLKTVIFDSKELTLDTGAFANCVSLVDVQNKEKDYELNVGYGAFSSDYSLEKLDFSTASGGIIDVTAVSHCKNLNTLILSEGIEFGDVAGQSANPNISAENGILLCCDAEIEYK